MGIGGIINFVNVTVHYVQIFLSRNCKFHKIRCVSDVQVRSIKRGVLDSLFVYVPSVVRPCVCNGSAPASSRGAPGAIARRLCA